MQKSPFVSVPVAIVASVPSPVTCDDGRDKADRVVSVLLLVADTLLATHDVHVPVRFVITPEAGVPSAGVVRVGELRVKPAIVVVVEPLAMLVDPIVIGNPLEPLTVCHP